MPLSDLTANALNPVEPYRQCNALLHIVGLTGGDDDKLVLAIDSFPLPKENSNVIEMHYLNEVRKLAGKSMYDDLSIVFKDLITQNIYKVLKDWRNLVLNTTGGTYSGIPTGGIGYQSDYKKNGYAILYSSKGTSDRLYNILGIWPSSLDPGDVDMSSDDLIRCNVTFSIDKISLNAGLTPPSAYPSGL